MLGKKYVSMYLVYLARIITTRPLYQYEYQFAICESCFWCATVFHKSIIKHEQGEDIISDSSNNKFQQQIKNKSVSLTPLFKTKYTEY